MREWSSWCIYSARPSQQRPSEEQTAKHEKWSGDRAGRSITRAAFCPHEVDIELELICAGSRRRIDYRISSRSSLDATESA